MPQVRGGGTRARRAILAPPFGRQDAAGVGIWRIRRIWRARAAVRAPSPRPSAQRRPERHLNREPQWADCVHTVVAEWLAERGVVVDRTAIYRWVQRFLPLFGVAARRHRTRVGRQWRVDETYCAFQGRQAYIYRALDEEGQVVDAYFSERRNAPAAQAFFERALAETEVTPVRVTTDKAKGYPPALRAVLPGGAAPGGAGTLRWRSGAPRESRLRRWYGRRAWQRADARAVQAAAACRAAWRAAT